MSRSSPTAARSAVLDASKRQCTRSTPTNSPFNPFMPSSAYAMAAARHMHQYGTTREQLAAVAVAAGEWAQLESLALDKKPLGCAVGAHGELSAYRACNISLVTDVGGEVIVTSADRAKSLKPRPMCGCAVDDARQHLHMPDLTVTGAVPSRGRPPTRWLSSGLLMSDAFDDAFTINTILFLEDLGNSARKVKGVGSSRTDASAGSLPREHQRRWPVVLPHPGTDCSC